MGASFQILLEDRISGKIIMGNLQRDELMAAAIYEIRLLLAGYLGSDCDAEPNVRLAAHLAYALHNDALTILDGDGNVDILAARKRILQSAKIVGHEYADGHSKFAP